MKARLLCKSGELKGSEFNIDSEATIGRSESNSIVLPSASVSSEHARIFRDDAGTFVLEDLGSRNGTRLDGKTLHGRQVLGGLHVVNFGRSADFVFVVVRAPESPGAPKSPDAPRAGTAPQDAGGGSPSSTVVDVEPLPLPASLAPRVADAETAGSRSGKTLVERDSPELPAALRGKPPTDEGPSGGT